MRKSGCRVHYMKTGVKDWKAKMFYLRQKHGDDEKMAKRIVSYMLPNRQSFLVLRLSRNPWDSRLPESMS